MRKLVISEECIQFIEKGDERLEKRFNYLVQIIIEQKIIHENFVKKLVGTEFYELRIKVQNEVRIMIFSIDHSNFNESNKVILLNGFVKKSKKDYIKAIKIASNLLEKYKDEL